AGAVEDGEEGRGGGAEGGETHDAYGMRQRGEAGGDDRMMVAHEGELEQSCRDLRRSDQRGGEDGGGKTGAGSLEHARQVRGHGGAGEPGGGEDEGERGHDGAPVRYRRGRSLLLRR